MISDEEIGGIDHNNHVASRGAGILDNSYEKKYVRNSRLIDRHDSDANKTEITRIIADDDLMDDS